MNSELINMTRAWDKEKKDWRQGVRTQGVRSIHCWSTITQGEQGQLTEFICDKGSANY